MDGDAKMKHTVHIGRRSVFNRKPVEIFYPQNSAPFAGNAFLPGVAVIPLRQYDGVAARSVIQPGASVKEGQVIAVAKDPESAVIHSSVPGVLRGYREMPLVDQTVGTAAVIQLSGSFDISGKKSGRFLWEGASPWMLLKSVEDFGVVSTFSDFKPLAFLLRNFMTGSGDSNESGEEASSLQTVLAVRMFDGDPSCAVDSYLVENNISEVLEGCSIVAKILDINKICFIHRKKTSFFENDVSSLFHHASVEIKQTAANVYPYGNSILCAGEAAGMFPGTRKKDVFCMDPWTAFSVCESVCFNKPTLQRPVLIAGSAIEKSMILNVRIGTRIGDIIEECGGFKFSPAKIIVNGLIEGRAVYDLDTPVDKNTKSLHFMSREECRPYSVHQCVHCGRCLGICPQKLDPIRVAYCVQRGKYSGKNDSLPDCIFCGACSAVCPSRIPIHHIIRDGLKENHSGGVL